MKKEGNEERGEKSRGREGSGGRGLAQACEHGDSIKFLVVKVLQHLRIELND